MKIHKSIEMPDGMFEIQGEFSAEEIQIILEVGLNTLYATGALPFKTKLQLADIQPFTGETQ